VNTLTRQRILHAARRGQFGSMKSSPGPSTGAFGRGRARFGAENFTHFHLLVARRSSAGTYELLDFLECAGRLRRETHEFGLQ
jgi:hypothetical protein